MRHHVWRPNSKRNPEVEMVCGLKLDMDERVTFMNTVTMHPSEPKFCPGCYGPTPDIHMSMEERAHDGV